ncbi:neural cell adhesion molecule 2-like isoform X2 [Clavelina lepadiformis]|uniref:neural cell adhesion molecule 2-like isoform X2 n=1 Tax=Clavelina lepadiformis TaxID=159417 RepID=UPI004042852D
MTHIGLISLFALVASFLGNLTLAEDDLLELKVRPKLAVVDEKGTSFLTCSHANSITNVKWLDPDQNEITSDAKGMNIETEKKSIRLIFTDPKSHMNGRYSCNGYNTNLNQSVTVFGELRVYKELEFVNIKERQAFERGQDAEVVCEVQGNPGPKEIKWLKEKKGLDGTNSSRIYVNPDGNLVIRRIKKSDEGVYVCRAIEDFQTQLIKQKFTVDVEFAPKNLKVKEAETLNLGDSTKLSCHANAEPDPSYTWYRETVVNSTKQQTVITFGVEDGGAKLALVNVTLADEGRYVCEVRNKRGNINGTTDVVVQVPPTILHSNDDKVSVGGEATLSCEASGKPTPTVHFYKSGVYVNMSLVTQSPGSVSAEYDEGYARLSFNHASIEDRGQYECVATNDAGTVSENLNLDVLYAPQNKTLPTVSRCTGQSAQIVCSFDANPDPDLVWGQIVNEGQQEWETMFGEFVSKSSAPPCPDCVNASFKPLQLDQNFVVSTKNRMLILDIKNVTAQSFGEYYCKANNSQGENMASAELVEAQKPGVPRKVTVTDLSTTTVLVNFSPPSDIPVRIISYTVEVEEVGGGDSVITRTIDADEMIGSNPGAVIQEEFTDLNHDTNYFVKVRAENCQGLGEPNKPQPFKTERIDSPEAVKPKDNSPSHDRYTVEWELGESGGGNFQKIEILYKPFNAMNSSMGPIIIMSTDDEFLSKKYDLKDLTPQTNYEVKLVIYNEVGTATAVYNFTTGADGQFAHLDKKLDDSSAEESKNDQFEESYRNDRVTEPQVTKNYPIGDPAFRTDSKNVSKSNLFPENVLGGQMTGSKEKQNDSSAEESQKDQFEESYRNARITEPRVTKNYPIRDPVFRIYPTNVSAKVFTTDGGLTHFDKKPDDSGGKASQKDQFEDGYRNDTVTEKQVTKNYPIRDRGFRINSLNSTENISLAVPTKSPQEKSGDVGPRSGGVGLVAIIIIVVAVVVLIIVVDLSLCMQRHYGVSHFIYSHTCAPSSAGEGNAKELEEGSAEFRKDSKAEGVTNVVMSNEKQPLANDAAPIANGAENEHGIDNEETPLNKEEKNETKIEPTTVEQPPQEGAQQKPLSPADVTMEVADEQTKELLP